MTGRLANATTFVGTAVGHSRLIRAVAVVALALGFGLFASTPTYAASAPKHSVTPFSCFWVSDYTNSGSLTSGVGTYTVKVQHDTCNTSIHQAYGEIRITSTGNVSCNTGSFNVRLYANGIQVHSADASATVGHNSCSGGTVVSTVTDTYQGSANYCGKLVSVHWVIDYANISAGVSCP